jgi:hypothetical protein
LNYLLCPAENFKKPLKSRGFSSFERSILVDLGGS